MNAIASATPGPWPAIFSASGVVIGAVVAAIIALIGHIVVRSNAKLQTRIAREIAEQGNVISSNNVKLQTKLAANLKLAELRQSWINSLRDDMAAFQSLGVTPNLKQSEQQEFYRIGTRIELFMNPEDVDYPELQEALYAFLDVETIEEKYAANPRYVEICQRILKREWDVLKEEIRSVTN